MRRYLTLAAVLFILLGVAWSQHQANQVTAQSGEMTYLPMTLLQPTHTPTATATMVPPTATTAPAGTGVYRRQGDIQYRKWEGTKLYGFIYFFDGTPNTFGGPNGYRPVVCFDGTGCLGTGNAVDSTGYYDFPINGPPAKPIETTGHVFLVNGPNAQRVSNNVPIDTRNGSCFRIDFIECGAGDSSAQCRITDSMAEGTQFAGVTTALDTPDTPLACP